MSKLGNYIVKCIKLDNNGLLNLMYKCNVSVGEYVDCDGNGTKNINEAHIFNDFYKMYGCILNQWPNELWKDFFVFIPVNIIER